MTTWAKVTTGEDEWADYYASSTITGWSTQSGTIWVAKIGKIVLVRASISGTSNATTISFTVPYVAATFQGVGLSQFSKDNGTNQTTPAKAEIDVGTYIVNVYKDIAAGAWTSSGAKRVDICFWYPTA